MSDPRLKFTAPEGVFPPEGPVPLGRQLVQDGLITQRTLLNALGLQRRVDAQLGDILVAEGAIDNATLLRALAMQHAAQQIDLQASPPRAGMERALPAALCLQHSVVPWMWIDETLLVATARPDLFDHLRHCLGARGDHLLPVVADARDIQTQIGRLYTEELKARAVARVPAAISCRAMAGAAPSRTRAAAMVAGLLAALLIVWPNGTVTGIMLVCLATLILTSGLKLAAGIAQLRPRRVPPGGADPPPVAPFRLPRVSVMVPLFQEREIARALIQRLSLLTYPKSLLDVVLVLEAKDHLTRETLSRTALPPWMNVVEVPDDGQVTTKPRAMNYALDFCKGSIIGVWDAEDAPEPDQIERVVMRFAEAPPEVACLQGTLDFYNPRFNWMARCFTIEYATWWRLVMPGMARLGLVIPLGGTTLFFRRKVLDALGRWDAHNVTEDADLGVRLARNGYRTELIPTTTFEEANCRPWHWVRQRSRWLKGFLITWMVHMRQPAALVRDLGLWRAFGLQIIFLATFIQFAAAPLLWSFWLVAWGVGHPVEATLGTAFVRNLMWLFIGTELLNLALHMFAVRGPLHRHLMAWTPTMPVYFLLGALASYKALYEMIAQPFYWDKTEHGYAAEASLPKTAPTSRPAGAPHPVPDGS
ncbi:MAG: glycosyltransferase [Pseudomonadota bacterium]